MKKKPVKKKGKGKGSPKYTIALADRICELIATTDKGLHHICNKHKDLPCFSTVFNWLKDESKKSFLDKYAHAREAQGDFFAYKGVEIASKPLLQTHTIKVKDSESATGVTISEQTSDNVQRSRLMYEANKFMASKCNPKKYGDKVDVTSGGKEIKTAPPVLNILPMGSVIPVATSESDVDATRTDG